MSALSKPEERLLLLVWLGIFASLLCLLADAPLVAVRFFLVLDAVVAWLWLRDVDRRERFWRWLLSTVFWPGFACRVFGHSGWTSHGRKGNCFQCDLRVRPPKPGERCPRCHRTRPPERCALCAPPSIMGFPAALARKIIDYVRQLPPLVRRNG